MKLVRVASRKSVIGINQAHELMQAIHDCNPLIVSELVYIKPDSEARGKDPYLVACERALESGTADLCVHSLDELPLKLNPQLPVVAVSMRRRARDVLVRSFSRAEPDYTKPLGVQGAGRVGQLTKLFPKWRIVPTSGDVMSRLERLDNGVFGALVLSESDVYFMNQQERIYQAFSEKQMITSYGQGIVAVQGRLGDKLGFLAKYHSVDSWDMVLAEQSFSEILGFGSNAPVAVRASVNEETVRVQGVMVDQNGKQWEGKLSGKREDAAQLGAALAAKLQFDSTASKRKKKKGV